MKTILVPTDFSETAGTAAQVAAGLAVKTGATIVLLHVVEEVTEGSFNVEGEATASASWEDKIFTMRMVQKARKELTKQLDELKGAGVTVVGKLRLGSPFHGMQAIISESNVDLVVMGTRGSSGLAEIVVGSNTEKVVRRANCSVLSVNKKPLNTEFKSMVYATGLRDDEEVFTRVVKEFQLIYNSKIHIVRINTPGLFINDKLVFSKMEEIARQEGFNNYTLNVFNDYTEEEGIINFAENVKADLIAMATHGRTGLARILDGSIAEDVVNHSRRPVLTRVIRNK